MHKNYKTEQAGRSMVEMLGVLAVIGVLSITGISGYTTAMNKHKANEILDAASKRAVAVSTQIQRGNTNPTLAEFEGEAVQGVTFGTPVKVGDNQFKLPVTWASDTAKTTIGAQIKNIAGDGTGTVLVDSDVSRFLYNNDLSTGVSNTNNRDTNDATKCVTGYKGTDCDSCKANYGMHNGACVACSTVSATGTTSDVPATGYTGCYCTSDQTWDTENNECKSSGPYCANHTCTLGSSTLSWTEARSACGGIANMVTLADVGCTTDGCTSLPSSLKTGFWVAECDGESCDDDSSNNGKAYIVDGGYVTSLERNYCATPDFCGSQVTSLCK